LGKAKFKNQRFPFWAKKSRSLSKVKMTDFCISFCASIYFYASKVALSFPKASKKRFGKTPKGEI